MMIAAPQAIASPGDLDPGFSGDGLSEIQLGLKDGKGHQAARAVVEFIGTQPSGKLVVGGIVSYRTNLSPDDLTALARLDPTGELDPSFGQGGVIESDYGQHVSNRLHVVAMQPDGRILLAGSGPQPGQVQILRLTPDGQPDSSFANGGMATVTMPNASFAHRVSIAFQDDGQLVVAAMFFSDERQFSDDLGVFRLSPDGTLDSSYAAGGFRRIAIGPFATLGSASIDSLGRAVVTYARPTTYAQGSNAATTFVIRLLPSGQLDPMFGGAGTTSVDAPSGRGSAPPFAALDSLGRVYLPTPNGEPSAIVRLTEQGALDPAYGIGGSTSINPPQQTAVGGIAVDAADRLLIGAWGTSGTTLGVGRRLLAGSADTAFSPTGWTASAAPVAQLRSAQPLALADGRIVVAAGSDFGACFEVARFLGETSSSQPAQPNPKPCADPCKPVHGCPYILRRLTIHRGGRDVVRGKVRSKVTRCATRAKVQILQQDRVGVDQVMGSDKHVRKLDSTTGLYKVDLGPRARGQPRVYAHLDFQTDPAAGLCRETRSRTIRLDGKR